MCCWREASSAAALARLRGALHSGSLEAESDAHALTGFALDGHFAPWPPSATAPLLTDAFLAELAEARPRRTLGVVLLDFADAGTVRALLAHAPRVTAPEGG